MPKKSGRRRKPKRRGRPRKPKKPGRPKKKRRKREPQVEESPQVINFRKLLKRLEFYEERDLRAQCAALYQHAGWSKSKIAFHLKMTEGWVRKWCEETCFEDAERERGKAENSFDQRQLKSARALRG